MQATKPTTYWRGNAVLVAICLVLMGIQVAIFWHP
jgi:hypothetical protein